MKEIWVAQEYIIKANLRDSYYSGRIGVFSDLKTAKEAAKKWAEENDTDRYSIVSYNIMCYMVDGGILK